jgi:hypothetical protein
MRTHHLSIFLGLTATAAVYAPLPVQAASFNLDLLQNISSRPIESNQELNFFGTPLDNQGFTAYFNPNPFAPDRGHTEISLNSPGNRAPYYTTGRHASPEEPPSGATTSTTLNEIIGFSNFFSYLTNNDIPLSSIGFSYGQESDTDFTGAWNLGDDLIGQDWFASPDSTVEERIYTANPDDVEIFLSYGDTRIVNFGYSDIYTIFEYGATTSTIDDAELIFTDPLTAATVGVLDPLAAGLADAFLQDVMAGGGGVQLVSEDEAVDDVNVTTGNGFVILNIRFPASLRIVPSATVPEPSSVLGLLMFGALGAVSRMKKPTKKHGVST